MSPAAAPVPPSVASSTQRARFSPEYWMGLRFLLFGRAVPGALFGLMGWAQLNRVIFNVNHLPANAGMSTLGGKVLAPALYTAFCAIPTVLYLTRPAPKARDGRMVARTAAFTGTLMQLLVGTLLGAGPLLFRPPAVVGDISAALGVIAFAGALWSLAYLRRSLSIIPEARRLATGGPYRIVRHPLYFFEILAAFGAVISGPGAITVTSFIIFAGMQMTRAHFEERLLTAAFSDYAAYAQRTRRVIPFVW